MSLGPLEEQSVFITESAQVQFFAKVFRLLHLPSHSLETKVCPLLQHTPEQDLQAHTDQCESCIIESVESLLAHRL